jgi:hypothetical protein
MPVEVTNQFLLEENETITKMVHTGSTSYALTSNHRLFGWGNGYDYQMGNGIRSVYNHYQEITSYFNLLDDVIVDVIAGQNQVYVVTQNNHLYGFGVNACQSISVYYDSDLLYPMEIILNNGLVSTTIYQYGDDVVFPEVNKEGYDVVGWYEDYQLTIPIEEDFVLEKNLILYPKFETSVLTVRFLDDDGTVLKEELVPYGSQASPPPDPIKEATQQFTYTFSGWDKPFDNITDDLDVYATYTSVVNAYTVRFLDEDGGVLKTEDVPYGSSATPPPDPIKEATQQYTYTFSGWDKPFDNITDDLDVYATYASLVNAYTVRFLDEDGSVLKTEDVPYGSYATAPDDPTKESNIEYIYLFDGWDQSFDVIIDDLDVYATYIETKTSAYYALAPGVDTILKGDEWMDGGLTITNEHMTYITNGLVNTDTLGDYTIEYHLFYDDVELGVVQRIVSVIQLYHEPIITLNPGVSTLLVGQNYEEAGAITDIGEVEVISDIDTSRAGTYQVIYRVTIDDKVYEKYRYVIVYVLFSDWEDDAIIIPAGYRKEEDDHDLV